MSEEPKNVRLPIMVSESEALAIDDWRFTHRVGTRSEAIRRLITTGIKSEPILIDIMKMLVELRGVGPEHELDAHINQIVDALGRNPK